MPFLIQDKDLPPAERVQLVISYLLQLVLVIMGIFFLLRQEWFTAFLTFGILLLTFLPALLRRNYRVYLPIEFEALTVVFIFASLFLGEIHAYYTTFWWWDIVLHISSAALLGLMGFVLVYILNRERRLSIFLSPGFVALFAFAFAVALGVAWEIFEFSMDSFFGLHMQKSGLVDTMWDLIVDALGALMMAVLGYISLKHEQQSFMFRYFIRQMVRKNPGLFRKRRWGYF